MKLSTIAAATVAAGALAAAGHAPAAPLWEFSVPATAYTNNDWDFGNGFTTSPITIYALGYYYDPNNGWAGDHPVSLYTIGGGLVASADVTLSNCFLVGHFCYTSITPVAIAGSYEIDGGSGEDVYTWDDPGFFSNVTYDYNTWTVGGGDAYQGFVQNDVVDGYWGPNALFTSVPEPAAWVMMLLGSGLLGASLRRRQAQAIG
jgi:hypothetical protein